VDFSGLGDSRLGHFLRNNVPNEPRFVNENVAKFINDNATGQGASAVNSLEAIGLSCAGAEPICRYEGQATQKLVMPDGTVKPGDRIISKFDVTVNASKRPYDVLVTVDHQRPM
jgi:hypothetical protein